MNANDDIFTAVADHALLVKLGTEISDATSARVMAADKSIANDPPAGLLEVVPAFVNLLIEFDPNVTDHETIAEAITPLLAFSGEETLTGENHQVEVCYDIDLGPDLVSVANASGLSVDDVIESHLNGNYTVGMYGFAPGYAYLAGVPPEIQQPRKSAALRDIPAGSVLIAGPQCLVTTLDMPTGWWIIGRSPTQILRNDESQPFLFNIGDSVEFRQIDRDRFDRGGKVQD
ncbi:MAG: allophanate hydrolase subunit 1 [Pseudomonadota bacterium]